MQLDTVYQMQTINRIMYDQFYDYPVSSIMILGIAGGNGLNHIKPHVKKVYGVDINAEYLQACKIRYAHLGNTLETLQADVTKDAISLPNDITENDMTKTLMNISYKLIKTKEVALPNSKKLVRLDYKK